MNSGWKISPPLGFVTLPFKRNECETCNWWGMHKQTRSYFGDISDGKIYWGKGTAREILEIFGEFHTWFRGHTHDSWSMPASSIAQLLPWVMPQESELTMEPPRGSWLWVLTITIWCWNRASLGELYLWEIGSSVIMVEEPGTESRSCYTETTLQREWTQEIT